MQILAIESSSLTAGAAIIKDDVVLAEYSVSFKKTHSQTLLPMIDEVLVHLQDLESAVQQRRDYVWRLTSRLLKCLHLKLWRLDAVLIMV